MYKVENVMVVSGKLLPLVNIIPLIMLTEVKVWNRVQPS